MRRQAHLSTLRWQLLALLIATPVIGLVAPFTIGNAHAEKPAKIGEKLGDLEQQTIALVDGMRPPAKVTEDPEGSALRLVTAQVAFGMGNYDEAALTLFDLVAAGKVGKAGDYDITLYFLAESLFQKGDKAAARSYFTQLVDDVGARAKYFPEALARLVELQGTLGATDDSADASATDAQVEAWLAALDRSATGTRRALAVYVHGKYAFSQGKPDDAIQYFADVPRDSKFAMQAQYYTGTAYIAKQDFAKAVQSFSDLVAQKPRTSADRRVMELAQLALGRLFYERDQPSKAINAYLMIDRRSDLFPDALYEVAWVYVKGKQFDKALRALELLALADPTSPKTPAVRILEANLRIRKAQTLKAANVMSPEDPRAGAAPAPDPTLDPDAVKLVETPVTAEDEYGKARELFLGLHDTYAPSYTELARLIETNADPTAFLAQISGRSSRAFQTNATMPEIAAAWLRDEPAVTRVINIENDLADIAHNITTSEHTIARLEAMLAAPNGANVYPTLAQRRAKLAEILDDVIAMRSDVAEQLAALGVGSSDTPARQALGTELAGMPAVEQAYAARLARDQAEFDKLDAEVTDIDGVIGEARAESVALRHWARWLAILPPPVTGFPVGGAAPSGGGGGIATSLGGTPPAPTTPAPPATTVTAPEDGTAGAAAPAATEPDHAEILRNLDELDPELTAAQQELDEVRDEITFGHDLAGIGDETVIAARALRLRMQAAQDAEHRAQQAAAASARDPKAAQALLTVGAQAAKLATELARLDAQIERYIATGSAEVAGELISERGELESYRLEFAELEAESHLLGGLVLQDSVGVVKDKLYDVVIRSDVGVVDVSWSRKEEADEDLKRYGLARTRELKQIRDEFRDILDDVQKAPGSTP